MDLKTNGELINYYLNLLKKKKEEKLRNFVPVIITPEQQQEKLLYYKQQVIKDKELELERIINFNSLLRQHKEWKIYQRKLYIYKLNNPEDKEKSKTNKSDYFSKNIILPRKNTKKILK